MVGRGVGDEAEQVRWGVIGPGRIAHRFARCLPAVPGARLQAVAGRNVQRLQAFADEHGVASRHDRPEALCRDPQVDAVYIAATHDAHAEHALMAIEAGKAVLCEKPFTVNALQAERVIAAARARGSFLMEAMWTRFLPVYTPVRHWLRDGQIGEVTGVEAWFGYEQDPATQQRLYDPRVAGGALLDAGVYCVSIAHWLLGGPLQVLETRGAIGASGVDEDLFVRLSLARGVPLRMNASLRQRFYNAFVVHGRKGRIVVTDNFWDAGQALLMVDGRPAQAPHTPFAINGFEYQVREVHQCLRLGLQQSEVQPWRDTLEVMQCLDEVRARIGLRYPFEAST